MKLLQSIGAFKARRTKPGTGKQGGLAVATSKPVGGATGPNRRQSDEQLKFLSQAVILEEATNPKFVTTTAMVASLSVAGFLAWAALTPINEVSRAPGEVVPSGLEQVVQHLDGGLVKSILIQPGQLVENRQLLAKVDDGATREKLRQAREKLVHLKMTEARLRSATSGHKPDFSQFTTAKPGDVSAQLKLYRDSRDELVSRQEIVKEQIAQKKSDISILKGRLQAAIENLKSEGALLTIREGLYKKGLLTRSRLIKTQQGTVRLRSDVEKLEQQIKQAREALGEYRNRLNSLATADELQTANSLTETRAQIRTIESTIELLKERFARFELRAPVRGVIKDLKINTIGSVVKPGQVLMTIVPVDDELVADAQIRPHDIGHVYAGQPVNVKISAYDYSRYGVVKGTLKRISAATFKDSNGRSFYRGRIQLEQPYLVSSAGKHQILPGMAIMADIQTGEKTILDYLLKPVRVAATTALSER